MLEDEFKHFRQAQDPVYDDVIDELAAGQKRSHWMWFIFPQLAGLGRSEMAQRFALQSLEQARRYAADPAVGRRLRECTGLVNKVQGRNASEIFGYPDDLKFHSCMTLFALAVPDEPVFQAAMQKFFAGQTDEKTIELLKQMFSE
jgi:uncharacterized protein (DUF1810 family)